MDPAAYLVGNRVYRGASNAPTRGTVDPMGYINRSLGMSQVGGDGLSDTRSGLAQAAMQRLNGGGMGMSQPAPMSQQQPQMPQVPPPPDYTNSRGFTVSATGQLIPTPTGNPLAELQQGGAPPDPAQLMEAARHRLNHHVQVTETMSKHHLNMEKLRLQAAQTLERFQNRQAANG